MASLSNMARRLARLERSLPVDHTAKWRAALERCFTTPEYAEHREAIIEALCSAYPHYNFTVQAEDPEEYTGYHVSWWTRDTGGPPLVVRYPGAWVDGI